MDVCCICLEDVDNKYIYSCKQCTAVLHTDCFVSYFNYNCKRYANVLCPICKITIVKVNSPLNKFIVNRMNIFYQVLIFVLTLTIIINIMFYQNIVFYPDMNRTLLQIKFM
jgi:hypothetical protein